MDAQSTVFFVSKSIFFSGSHNKAGKRFESELPRPDTAKLANSLGKLYPGLVQRTRWGCLRWRNQRDPDDKGYGYAGTGSQID